MARSSPLSRRPRRRPRALRPYRPHPRIVGIRHLPEQFGRGAGRPRNAGRADRDRGPGDRRRGRAAARSAARDLAGRCGGPLPRRPRRAGRSRPTALSRLGPRGIGFRNRPLRVQTIKPGPVALGDGETAAPHINFWIVSRGVNIGLNTRMYFSDEEAANAADPVLNLIEPRARRQTLIGRRTERDGQTIYLFDIRLQGDDETVFFDV